MNVNENKKIPVIAVVGATASGKTKMAIELAKIFDAEVISADSMQIYKGMDIASAKPTVEEMQGIPHHLIDFLPSDEKYSVARFREDAKKAADDIRSRGKNIIICGGTGLYIDSFLDNIVFADEPENSVLRAELEKRRDDEGIEALYNELKNADPETAESLHINNEGRIIRALESYILTGVKPSEARRLSRSAPTPYEAVYICPAYENRQVLYDRINTRVDIMIKNGLVKEAEEYFSLDKKDTSSQAIGHKEIVPFLTGEISLDEAADNLKKATRHYAKRQMTWFRRNDRINYIYCDKYESFADAVNKAAAVIEKTGLFERGGVY
ncbi:MAG: tRNA (adenosine(37)-N6)-dimethylallyltransferase MiaA [Clostridia bacterium]|nr:tRNA (adenosine(37)-N6)-dimethylallyltransferase MiaA [Clostridia bacterium]